MAALIITLLFGILADDLAVAFGLSRSDSTVGIGVGLAMVVCVGGALPTIVLQVALLQTSWHQGASWLVQALLQYVAGGAFIGQVSSLSLCVCVCARARACARACVRACVRVCLSVFLSVYLFVRLTFSVSDSVVLYPRLHTELLSRAAANSGPGRGAAVTLR